MYYHILIYPIASNLWRWEVRCSGALIRCGTSRTSIAAGNEVHEIVGAQDEFTPDRGPSHVADHDE